jgi:hypothetical protein
LAATRQLTNLTVPSAVRPQQYFRQPSELGATGVLTSVFIEQPTQLDLTNAEVTESGLQANSSARSG